MGEEHRLLVYGSCRDICSLHVVCLTVPPTTGAGHPASPPSLSQWALSQSRFGVLPRSVLPRGRLTGADKGATSICRSQQPKAWPAVVRSYSSFGAPVTIRCRVFNLWLADKLRMLIGGCCDR